MEENVKQMFHCLVTTVVLAAGISSASAQSTSKDPIKVGILLGLTGTSAGYTLDERRAAEAVTEKVNSAGGINGRKIELVIRDTKTNPTEAARVASQVILDDKVVAILGAGTASETLAFADFAARNQTPIFAPTASQSVTDPSTSYFKWIFRMAPPLSADAPKLMDKVKADGRKTIAIFVQEDAYGQQASEMMKDYANKNGIKIAEIVSAPISNTDFTTHAIKLRNARPDAVLIAASQTQTASSMLRKLREMGSTAPVYGVSALVSSAILEAAGPAAEGLIALSNSNPFDPGPLKPLVELLKDHGGNRSYGSVCGATAMEAIVQALRTGATTGSEIRDTVEKMGPIKLYAAAPVEYSETNHDGWGPGTMFFVTVKDGKFVNL